MRLLHADDLTSLRLKFQSGRQMQLAVFVSSFLGYGANEALKAYILALTQGAGSAKVIDPCLPIGYSTTEHNVSLNGSGSFEKCYLGITPLLKKDKECKELPCLFDGVHAPLSDIQNHHFIGVSEFWYTTFDIFHLGGPYRYDILRDAAKTYCASTWENVTSRYNANEFSNIENVSRLHEQCFKVSYIMNILHEGLGMQNDAHASGKPTFETVQNIRRFDVSWTLGAIFMLASSAILDTEQPAFSVLPITVVICVNLAIAACIIFRKRLRKGMLDMGYFHRETPYQLLPLPTVRPSKFKALE